jgi:hypothetical protein
VRAPACACVRVRARVCVLTILTPNLRQSISPIDLASSSANFEPDARCHASAPAAMWWWPHTSQGISALGASRLNCVRACVRVCVVVGVCVCVCVCVGGCECVWARASTVRGTTSTTKSGEWGAYDQPQTWMATGRCTRSACDGTSTSARHHRDSS